MRCLCLFYGRMCLLTAVSLIFNASILRVQNTQVENITSRHCKTFPCSLQDSFVLNNQSLVGGLGAELGRPLGRHISVDCAPVHILKGFFQIS